MTTLQDRAAAIFADAQEAKRQERAFRREARAKMDELRRFCEFYGIAFSPGEAGPNNGGADTNSRNT